MNRAILLRRAAAAGLAAALLASPASAATFVVTKTADTNDGACDADCSLREAVIAANADAAADTIVLPEGQFPLSIAGANEDAAATGDFDILNPVTIIGQGGRDLDASFVNAGALDLDRVFEVRPNVGPVEFRGFSMYGGSAKVRPGEFLADGGALYVGSGANVTLRSCTVGTSFANRGGGIFAAGGSRLTLRDVLLENNSADRRGGGLYAFGGDVEVYASAIQENSVPSGSFAGPGGGVFLSSAMLTVRDSAFTDNRTANSGGAIYGEYAGIDVAGSEFAGNRATLYGGAIARYALDDPPMLVVNSTFSGNETTSASDGAGGAVSIYFDGFFPATATFANTTFAGNTAAKGASQIDCQLCAEQNLRMRSSIVVGAAPLCNAPVVTQGGNLATDASCGFTDATDAENVADMKLAALADNGGLTRTRELLVGSPALGAAVDGDPATPEDQRGYGRDGDPDSGAYERLGGGGSGFNCPRDQERIAEFLEYALAGLLPAEVTPGRLVRCLNQLYD